MLINVSTPTVCVLQFICQNLEIVVDPIDVDPNPGSTLDKKWIKIRIQVLNISLGFTDFLTKQNCQISFFISPLFTLILEPFRDHEIFLISCFLTVKISSDLRFKI